jgi:hypothetical protein
MTSSPPQGRPAFWWSNAIFFCGTHLAAAYGVYRRPPTTVPKMILVVTIVLWQLGSFGYAYMRSYYVVSRLTDHYKDYYRIPPSVLPSIIQSIAWYTCRIRVGWG